jgi:regulator of protease activity HflC (stomatin/prohibitin superfamily)
VLDGLEDSFGLLIVAAVFLFAVLVVLSQTVRIVSQGNAGIVERLGRYSRTLEPGLHLLFPFLDRLRRPLVDLREQVVAFPPHPVITQDNVTISIDTVFYFTITDPFRATYEVAHLLVAVEQLTVTTLRNVIGSLSLEETLTSRDKINADLRIVLDEATERWGIRVNRIELKSIDPPASIQEAMEKQMRAERDRRAVILEAEGQKQSQILTAEGHKQSQILTAEGEKQSQILRAEGDAQSQILRAEGEARAILQVFGAIHEGDADPKLLAYQYLQMLPEIANGTASKLWVVPTEFTAALGSIAKGFGGTPGTPGIPAEPTGDDSGDGGTRAGLSAALASSGLQDPGEALAEARRQAEAATADATSSGTRSGMPFDPSVERGQRPQGETHQAPPPPQAQPRTLGEGETPPAPPQP